MVAGETRIVRGTDAERRGRASIPLGEPAPITSSDFVLGTTMPSLSNTGPRYPLNTYTGANAGGNLTVNTAGTTYERIDFGTTWITVAAANVTFRDCKFLNTRNVTTARGMIDAQGSAVSNLKIEFCEFRNVPSGGNVTALLNAITGHDFMMTRCNMRGFTDGIGIYPTSANSGGPTNARVEGSYINELGWWYNSTSGIVHPSDTKTHNDAIQIQGGTGTQIVGNYIGGYYSTTIGTDVPATGKRYEIVFGNGAYPAGNGGSLAAMMFSESSRGPIRSSIITDNWIGGGAFSINAGDDALTSPFGTVHRNRFFRDQRHAGMAIVIDTGVTADTGEGTSNRNIWFDNSTEVARKNG